MSTEALAIVVPAIAAVAIAVVSLIHQGNVTERTLAHQAELNKATLDHQAALNQATLDHQREVAREERVQARIASIYEDLLVMVDYVMEVVRTTQPVMEPGPEPPPEPDRQEARRVQARVGAHGSSEVKTLIYERWAPTRNKFFAEARTLATIREAQGQGQNVKEEYGITVSQQFITVDGLRKELNGIVRELEDQVNEELRG